MLIANPIYDTAFKQVLRDPEVPAPVIDFKGEVQTPGMKRMLDILHHIATDPEERKKLDEEAYWARYDRMGAGQILELQDTIAKQAQALQAEKQKAHDAKLATARKLKAKGMTAQEVADLTELTVEEVEGL
jgi:hypothetical protein